MVVTIQQDFMREEVIERSRFICTLKRAHSEGEARQIVAAIKKGNYRANHNCSAYILGNQQEVQHSSDDGEPSGTAGIPMLEVLRKREVTDVVAIVTRYFGGIKLGAGGLIREYAGSVARALDEAQLARIVPQVEITMRLAYPDYDPIQQFLKVEGLSIANSEFGSDIIAHVYIDQDAIDSFLDRLTREFNGRIAAQLGEAKLVEVALTGIN